MSLIQSRHSSVRCVCPSVPNSRNRCSERASYVFSDSNLNMWLVGSGLASALDRTLASSFREEGEHRHHLDTQTGLNKEANLSFQKPFEVAIGVRWLPLGVI